LSHSEKRVLRTHFSPICIISPAKPRKLWILYALRRGGKYYRSLVYTLSDTILFFSALALFICLYLLFGDSFHPIYPMKKKYNPKYIRKRGVQGLRPWWVGHCQTQNEVFARLFQKAVGPRGKAPGGFGQSPISFSLYI